MRVKRQLKEQGIEICEDAPCGSSCAYSWKNMAEFYLARMPDFLPKTMSLIHGLAERDIAFLRDRKEFDSNNQSDLYRKYLVEEVVPFYSIDSIRKCDFISGAANFDDLESIKSDLFINSFLFLLAHAEAESLFHYNGTKFSILAMHIPEKGNPLDSPIKLFFMLWMKVLGLDRSHKRQTLSHGHGYMMGDWN